MDSRLVLVLLFVTLTGCFMGTYAQNNARDTNTNGTSTNGTGTNGPSTNGTGTNGPNMNGTSTNGTSTNGPSTNGPNMNGTSTNGTSTNGPNTNGTSTNGPSTNGPNMNGTSTNGPSANGTGTNGPNMNGTSTNGTSTNGPGTNGPNMNGTSTNGTSTNGPSTNGPNMNGTSTNGTSTNGPNMNGTGTTTAVPPTPPPIVFNGTVTNLTTTISRNDCGRTQLCAAKPTGCDPSNGICSFLAAQGLGGRNIRFALSGESDGYIAATLSRNTTLGSNETTYICANKNGVVKYLSALLNNNKLIVTTLNVNNVKGRVNGKKIQCQFDATVPDSTSTKTRAATGGTSFSMSVSTGSYNATSDDLGSPTFQIQTGVVDLTNVNATINNVLGSNSSIGTTAAPGGNAVTIQQSMMQALLITVGVLSLTWL